MDSFYRYYLAQEIHPVDDAVLDRALEDFEGAALKFSVDFISDAEQRDNYNRNVKRVKAEVLAQVKSGNVSVREAAEFCYEMRNKIMAEVRAKTSVHGRAVAENKKMVSSSLEKLMDEKAVAKFGRKFGELSSQQKSAIHYEIIESSARPHATYNVLNKTLKVTGKVLIVVTIAYAAYDIANAENKKNEAIRQGATIGGGVLGTYAAGATVSLVCGVGAPVCTIAFMLAGGFAGGWFASRGMDFFDDEIEEFTKWGVR
ncbi:hypothetical protein J3D54_005194 [Pseudomonas sp. GGS8]|uniref:hypothetical protein n=1 Tax=Pseudomonas sp. GGS8 TaxID=2817892 RepID=UPI00209DE7A9|nr:hypothetical protein [Pseudomonas sp. GGS8]MCP1446062.1 hypothetical protein [Pseudomonas sp. GGS8]